MFAESRQINANRLDSFAKIRMEPVRLCNGLRRAVLSPGQKDRENGHVITFGPKRERAGTIRKRRSFTACSRYMGGLIAAAPATAPSVDKYRIRRRFQPGRSRARLTRPGRRGVQARSVLRAGLARPGYVSTAWITSVPTLVAMDAWRARQGYAPSTRRKTRRRPVVGHVARRFAVELCSRRSACSGPLMTVTRAGMTLGGRSSAGVAQRHVEPDRPSWARDGRSQAVGPARAGRAALATNALTGSTIASCAHRSPARARPCRRKRRKYPIARTVPACRPIRTVRVSVN